MTSYSWLVAHVASALQLTALNRKARPTPYKMKKDRTTSAAAKSMTYGGIAILLYVIFHLAHLTFGVTAGMGYDPNALDFAFFSPFADIWHIKKCSYSIAGLSAWL